MKVRISRKGKSEDGEELFDVEKEKLTFLIHYQCGKSFPVNPEKHKNRDYQICPLCGRINRKLDYFRKKWTPNARRAEKKRKITQSVLEQGYIKNETNGIISKMSDEEILSW